jgi:hypothetical protein
MYRKKKVFIIFFEIQNCVHVNENVLGFCLGTSVPNSDSNLWSLFKQNCVGTCLCFLLLLFGRIFIPHMNDSSVCNNRRGLSNNNANNKTGSKAKRISQAGNPSPIRDFEQNVCSLVALRRRACARLVGLI